jgi:hypothetical protein
MSEILSKYKILALFSLQKFSWSFVGYIFVDFLNKFFPMIVFIVLMRAVAFLVSGMEHFRLPGTSVDLDTPSLMGIVLILICLQPLVKVISEIIFENLVANAMRSFASASIQKRKAQLVTHERLKIPKAMDTLALDRAEATFRGFFMLIPSVTIIAICILVLSLALTPMLLFSCLLIFLAFTLANKLVLSKMPEDAVKRVQVATRRKWARLLTQKLSAKTVRQFDQIEDAEGFLKRSLGQKLSYIPVFKRNIPFVFGAIIILALVSHLSWLIATYPQEDLVNVVVLVIIIRFLANFFRTAYLQSHSLAKYLKRNHKDFWKTLT